MNKKLLIAIVVIVLVIIGVFLFMTYGKGGDNTTGAATEVPEENADETPETGTDGGKFSEITEEMSKADVVDLIGEPTDKQTITTPKGNVIEYWYYTDSSNQVWQVGFDSVGVSVVRKY